MRDRGERESKSESDERIDGETSTGDPRREKEIKREVRQVEQRERKREKRREGRKGRERERRLEGG